MIRRACIVTVCVMAAVAGCVAIQCYECVHNSQRMKRQQRYVYPCYDFDGSSKFIRQCPDSEFCVYQHVTLTLATGGVVKVHTMDGCTPNVTRLIQYGEGGLVQAGCIQHISRYRPPSSVYCYCDQDLCNGGSRAERMHSGNKEGIEHSGAGNSSAVTAMILWVVLLATTRLLFVNVSS